MTFMSRVIDARQKLLAGRSKTDVISLHGSCVYAEATRAYVPMDDGTMARMGRLSAEAYSWIAIVPQNAPSWPTNEQGAIVMQNAEERRRRHRSAFSRALVSERQEEYLERKLKRW